jgi:hypothetical protein
MKAAGPYEPLVYFLKQKNYEEHCLNSTDIKFIMTARYSTSKYGTPNFGGR